MIPRDVYSRKGNAYGKSGLVLTIPELADDYLVFSRIKPSRSLTEKIYSAARKKISISSHQELQKYRSLLATLVGSHLKIKTDQALLESNLAEFCIRKKIPILPSEIHAEFLRATPHWEEIEKGFKLLGPQTIQFSSLSKVEDKLLVDSSNKTLGIIEAISQAYNGTLLLSVLTKVPSTDEFESLLKTYVAKKNAAKKLAKSLNIEQETALTLRNIMKYQINQGRFKDLQQFKQFREEMFKPMAVPYSGIRKIEDEKVQYFGSSQKEAQLSDNPINSSSNNPNTSGETFYSFEELLNNY